MSDAADGQTNTQSIELRGGENCLIRDAELSDSSGLWKAETAIIAAGIGVVQDLTDIPGDLQTYETQLNEKLARLTGNGVLLVAELKSTIIGYIQIDRLPPARIRHVAELAIGVHPDGQGMGIGRALMQAGLKSIRTLTDPPIERVQLGVDASNNRARRLYTECGFLDEGLRRGFHMRPNGETVDDVMMALHLGEVDRDGDRPGGP